MPLVGSESRDGGERERGEGRGLPLDQSRPAAFLLNKSSFGNVFSFWPFLGAHSSERFPRPYLPRSGIAVIFGAGILPLNKPRRLGYSNLQQP